MLSMNKENNNNDKNMGMMDPITQHRARGGCGNAIENNFRGSGSPVVCWDS